MKAILILLMCLATYVHATLYVLDVDESGSVLEATLLPSGKYELQATDPTSNWTPTGGGNHGGSDWIISSSMNVGGVHYNIGTFTVTNASVVSIRPTFAVMADDINIYTPSFISAEGRGGVGGGGGGGGGGQGSSGGDGGDSGKGNGNAGEDGDGAVGGGTGGDGGDGSSGGGLYGGSGGSGGDGGELLTNGDGGDSGSHGGYNSAYDGVNFGNTPEVVESVLVFAGSGGGSGGAGGGGGRKGAPSAAGGGGGGGSAGGGSGGGRVALTANNSIFISGRILVSGTKGMNGSNGSNGSGSVGGAGGNGGSYAQSGQGNPSAGSGGSGVSTAGDGGNAGGAGRGAGGGILVKGDTVNLTGTSDLEAKNSSGNYLNTNGGTIKIWYDSSATTNGTIHATRIYTNEF